MFFRIIINEIRHRFLGFTLGVVSVIIAVGSLVGAFSLLKAHDMETERITDKMKKELEQSIAKTKDDLRKITKKMGFNVFIIPKEQKLSELWAQDYASADMPAEYARKLADSKIMTVRHLLPVLQKKIFWDTFKSEIILIGIQGEIPLMHRTTRKPILKPVKPGTAVLGYAVHSQLGVKKDGKITIMGKEFTVRECIPERGSKDDITVWIDLEAVQKMLNKPGRINGIWALECKCAWADLPKIKKEIQKILPGTQVIEDKQKALTRAETRWAADREEKAVLKAEEKNRALLRAEKERLASILVPLIILGSGIWIGILAFSNVKDRQSEIGILRAIGVRSGKILMIFLVRAGLIGLVGAAVGFAAGTLIIQLIEGEPLWSLVLGVSVIAASPVLSCIASWIPAFIGANQDPADILREE